MVSDLEIFLVTAPGLEAALLDEVTQAGFRQPAKSVGGVTIVGDWRDVWRANLDIRGAARILVRIAAFRAMHLAQLDKRAQKLDWPAILRPDVPFRVEASTRKSRIYHSGAAAQRVERAIRAQLGAPVAEDAPVVVKLRIEDDLATVSIDSSGEALHKRGHKEAVNRAPMRETMAALFLRQCGFAGQEPVVDPMCGSGTFVIEAAEIAAGLKPGRSRSFAFEHLAGFDAAAWQAMRDKAAEPRPTPLRFFGSDRDAGAIEMSRANAARAGVEGLTDFRQRTVSDLSPPEGVPPGLVIVNPPYGDRLGDRKTLAPLYRALGQALRERFAGWRAGIITTDPALMKATGLPLQPPGPPVLHGGIRVMLWQAHLR